MHANVLRNIIFMFYIFRSNGFPQDNIETDDQEPQYIPQDTNYQNGTDNNNLTDQISENEHEDDDDGAKDYDQLGSGQEYDDDDALDYDQLGSGQEDDDDGTLDYDQLGSGQEDYLESMEDYRNVAFQKVKSPMINASDDDNILNRNKPEPGFELTHDEMLKFKIWPSGLIPYYIDVVSFSDKALRDKIRSFLSSVNSLTSLNFVELPRPPDDDSRWVFFINRRGLLGCADHSVKNFTTTGVQKVVIGYDCMITDGELAEAVLAIAGVPAQHNAPDRDYYIKVNHENIMPDKKYLFEKLYDDEWLFHNLQYDFNSVGHYHSHKYSVNGRTTIEPRDNTSITTIGYSITLTAYDILKIRMLYNFIVKQKQFEAPECHKLFVPGSKFHHYKPTDTIEPRPKPYKYLGEGNDTFNRDGVGNIDDVEKGSNQHENTDVNEYEPVERDENKLYNDNINEDLINIEQDKTAVYDNVNGTENHDKNSVLYEDVKPITGNSGKIEGFKKDKIAIHDNVSSNENDDTNSNENKKPSLTSSGEIEVMKKLKKRKTHNKDKISHFSDYQSDKIQMLSYEHPIRKKKSSKPDKITVLTDYENTDEENMTKKKNG